MHRFIIERDIPNIGAADVITLRNTAKRSNETLRQLGGEIQWVESFISGDKIFCVYRRERRHHSQAFANERHTRHTDL